MTCILCAPGPTPDTVVARLDIGERELPPRFFVWGERKFEIDSAVYREVQTAVPAAAANKREKEEVAGGL